MATIKKQDWQTIPEQAQQEVYDFFLFVKNKYTENNVQDNSETLAFSNHSANLIDEWQNAQEDEVWK